jgi:hypothetical protein
MPMAPLGPMAQAPPAPAVAAPRQHADPEHRAIEEQRRAIDDQRRKLHQQELELARKQMELEARPSSRAAGRGHASAPPATRRKPYGSRSGPS